MNSHDATRRRAGALDVLASERSSEEAPAHPFIVPVPPEVDGWILEMRVPVPDEGRLRWIPFEFDGVTCYLVPLKL